MFRFTAEAASHLHTGEQLVWLAQLDEEHDNLRLAINWAKSNNLGKIGLHLAGNLARFWYLCGYWKEGRAYLHSLLTVTNGDQPFASTLAQARIKVLHGASWLADEDGSEVPLYTESLALCRKSGFGGGRNKKTTSPLRLPTITKVCACVSRSGINMALPSRLNDLPPSPTVQSKPYNFWPPPMPCAKPSAHRFSPLARKAMINI